MLDRVDLNETRGDTLLLTGWLKIGTSFQRTLNNVGE